MMERITEGFSAASVVLIAFGIEVDVAFLRYSMYDLVIRNISKD